MSSYNFFRIPFNISEVEVEVDSFPLDALLHLIFTGISREERMMLQF